MIWLRVLFPTHFLYNSFCLKLGVFFATDIYLCPNYRQVSLLFIFNVSCDQVGKYFSSVVSLHAENAIVVFFKLTFFVFVFAIL